MRLSVASMHTHSKSPTSMRWDSVLPAGDPPATKPALRQGQIDKGLAESKIRSARLVSRDIRNYWQSIAKIDARAVLVTGTERHSHQPLALYYFGTGDNLDYLLHRFFREHELNPVADGLHAWSARSFLQRMPSEADLAVADLPWPYHVPVRRGRCVEIPPWVEQKLILGGTWDSVMNGFRRKTRANDLRVIRKYGLTGRFSSKEEDASYFYEHMYRPYIERRFGHLAFSESRDRIIKYATTAGRLLQIIRDSRVIAAAVLCAADRRLLCYWVGVERSLSAEEAGAAVSALYYYPIRFGYEQGFDEIYFGFSRPLLNDGGYRAKRKWGATVYDTGSLQRLLLWPRRFSTGMVGILAGNPWLVSTNGGLVGKLLVEGGTLERAELERLVTSNSAAGIDRLHVLATGGVTSEAAGWAGDEGLALTLTDLTTVTDPIASYCGD